MGGYLTHLWVDWAGVEDVDRFPVNIPAIANLGHLDLHPQVTFLTGENGSGKSTLIEAIAVRLGYAEQGGTKNFNFGQREVDGGLHDYLRIDRDLRIRESDGFFLRAESFFNVASQVDELEVTRHYGGKSLHHQSHGEAFISLVQNRFSDESLFILDEPEAALSPNRQLVLLKEIDWLVKSRGQFIIATHSPILMSYPNAKIYWLGENGIAERAWEDIEHVELTKTFLNSPKTFLRHLFDQG